MQIHYNAARGDIDAVKYDLHHRAKVDEHLGTYYDGTMTPLMFAARSPFAGLDMVQFLIDKGANVNAIGGEIEYSPLGLAAKNGQIEKVKLLLKSGADPNLQTSQLYTPLIHAAYTHSDRARHRLFKLLLDAGANPNVTTTYGESALKTASGYGDFESVNLLIDAGVDLSPLQWTPLMKAVAMGTIDEVLKELEIPIDATQVDSLKRTAFGISIARGDVHISKLLTKYGFELYIRDIHFAFRHDNVNMLQWLLHIYPTALEDYGDDLLSDAASYGATRCTETLIELGMDVNLHNSLYGKPITSAGNAEIARLLINAGADIDYINGEGYNLLKYTVEDGHLDMVKELLDIGADPNVSSIGETPLYTAVLHDHYKIIQALLEYGADANITDVDGCHILNFAKTAKTINLLLEAGANPLYGEHFNTSPVTYHKDPEIISILKKAEQKARHKKSK